MPSNGRPLGEEEEVIIISIMFQPYMAIVRDAQQF
jgi:hypothetical protein